MPVDGVSSIASQPSQSLVDLRGIGKSYGGVPVLKHADLTVAVEEIHGLVGENGAGKSTLVKILAGEVPRDSGEIRWLGQPTPLASRADAERLGVTMIHQELNLAPHLTVAENLFLGHERTRFGWPFRIIDRGRELSEVQDLLSRIGFDLDPQMQVRRLRPAQRQLVEIARAVIRATRLVIMDEPTSSLSSPEVEELFRVVQQLKQRGTAVIFVTHRLEELAQIADCVTVLRDGETVHKGPMPRQDFGELIRALVGRELKDFFPPRSSRRGKLALEAHNLTRPGSFADVSFGVHEGEIVGLAGLTGAGRTELAEAIFGVAPPVEGRIFIHGEQATIRSPKDAVRRGLAFITEDRKRTGLTLNLGVAENITLANISGITRWGLIHLKKEEQVTRQLSDRLQIRATSLAQKVSRQKVNRLSGGNQQKVVLAKWLFPQGRIFLFDEPTRGVDVGVKTEIYRIMNELAEAGAAILMISSDLPEILGMTDRVLVMRNGRLVRELVTAQTTQEEIMRYAALGQQELATELEGNSQAQRPIQL